MSSYAGLRPLYDDGALKASVVTRDYAFDLDAPEDSAPSLSIFGGKITTARRLAEHALSELSRFLPAHGEAWTADAIFPGGDMPQGFDRFLADLKRDKPFLGDALALRLARAYGTRVFQILKDARAMSDLGRDFGCGLTEAEIAYLREKEWARTADDILWRRSKLGLAYERRAAAGVAGVYRRLTTPAPPGRAGEGSYPRSRRSWSCDPDRTPRCPGVDGRHKAGHDVVATALRIRLTPQAPHATRSPMRRRRSRIFANPGAAIAIFSAKKRASAA